MVRMKFAAIMLGAALCSFGDNRPLVDGKPDLSGKWQAEGNASQTVIIEQSPDAISIRELGSGDEERTQLRCGIRGSECSGRVSGQDAKVLFYFNGPMLVQMTTQGKNISKTRRTLSDDGKRITIEHMPLVPSGKSQTSVLIRAEGTQAQASSGAQ